MRSVSIGADFLRSIQSDHSSQKQKEFIRQEKARAILEYEEVRQDWEECKKKIDGMKDLKDVHKELDEIVKKVGKRSKDIKVK